MSRRILGVAACTALALCAVVVVSHDAYQAASFRAYELLCQRSDGSLWRDPSQGCTGGEDPRCTQGTACADSTMVSERRLSTFLRQVCSRISESWVAPRRVC